MKTTIGFFQDDIDSWSWSRLVLFIFAILTVVCTLYSLYEYGWQACIAVFSSMAAIVLSSKAVTKSQETIDNKIYGGTA